jgi:hypothetical protein
MRVARSRPLTLNSTPRRRTGGFAWLAALTMTVLAVTPLSAIFHQIYAPHAVCEHGEFVESGENRLSVADFAGLSVEIAAERARSAPATEIGADSESARHGHNHCSAGTLAKSNVALLPCMQVVAALSEVAVGGVQDCEFAHVRTILLSAPKTSPPHVAS